MRNNMEHIELDEKFVIELFEKTGNRTIIWKKRRNQKNSYLVDCDYVCNYKGCEIVFSIFGKNNEGMWKITKCIKVNDRKIEYDNPEFYECFLNKIIKQTKRTFEDVKKTEKEFDLDIKNIKASDFVIKTKEFKCYTIRHPLEISPGTVRIIQKNGHVVTEGVIVAYCPKCKCYFMKNYDYDKLRRHGIVVCRKVNFLTFMKNDFKWYNLSVLKGSLLTWQGYNVIENYHTEQQRQKLLAVLIEEGIFTKEGIIKELKWNIYVSKRKSELKGAIERWEKDILFLEKYVQKENRE